MTEAVSEGGGLYAVPGDTVGIARAPLARGTRIGSLTIVADILAGHKVSLVPLEAGTEVIKNGHVIAVAAEPIPAGAQVHTHNLVPVLSAHSRRSLDEACEASASSGLTFDGFLRPDGRAGTRNFLGIFALSNCAATAARRVAEEMQLACPGIDGVIASIHDLGCGMELSEEPMDLLRRTIAGHIRNPNIYGGVIVALGCERNNLDRFLEAQGLSQSETLRAVTIQEAGGMGPAMEEVSSHLWDMLPGAQRCKRTPLPLSKLTLALQSGGIDGLSAAATLPAMGALTDRILAEGATVIASQTPRLAAAREELLAQARDNAVAGLLRERLEWWQSYARGRDTTLSGRLHRRVIDSGISAWRELGLDTQLMLGRAKLDDIVRYGQPVARKGMILMDSPSDDAISVTGQVASGATLTAMAADLGLLFGYKPAPVLSLKSRTGGPDADITGLLAGASPEEMAENAIQRVIEVASGAPTASERMGLGDNEFVPWPIGVVS